MLKAALKSEMDSESALAMPPDDLGGYERDKKEEEKKPPPPTPPPYQKPPPEPKFAQLPAAEQNRRPQIGRA